MAATLFSDLENQSPGSEKNKPFFALDHENDQVLLDWFKAQIQFLKEENQDRLQKVKNNYLRYKGIQYLDQKSQGRNQPDVQTRYMPQMVVPLISDVVDEKVARLLEYKPAVQCIPQSDETQDKVDSKVAKRFLRHVDQVESLDIKFHRAVKSAKIAGESFLFILWSKDKGATILKAGQTVTLPDGRTIKGPVQEGDVSAKNGTALEVLYEQARSWDEVEYLFYFDYEYTEKLKREYPENIDKIHETSVTQFYDFENHQMKTLEGKTSRITFWHKQTKFLPEGFEAIFTMDCILKKGNLPYEHGLLPLIRFVDGENEQELSGEAGIDKTKSMASGYNNLTNMVNKQIFLGAYPKWFVEGGSVDDQKLGNDMTIVHVKPGSRPPVLAQSNPVSPQVFEYRRELKQEYYEMSKSNSVVRGDPPPGVTAFVALQFVSESENRRISSDVTKTNEAIRLTYDLILKVCGQYYKKTDKRTILIMGKDNRWTMQKFDPSTIAKPYSIILQNSSALPESKALRTQFILDMGQRFPNMFPESQISEMLDLGQNEKLLDLAGLAARAAEDENELILDGEAIPDPEIHEDLITHWRVHVSAIQDIGFKMKSSDEVQSNMKDHIMAHEYLMMDMAGKSTAFAQLLNASCPQFPMFLELPAPQASAPGPMPQVDQQGEVPKIQPLPGDPAFGTPTPEQTGVSPGASSLAPQ
jgi:hypothetical protein